MAWTKTKIIITTVGAVLLFGTAVVVTTKTIHAKRKTSVPDIQGTWEGLAKIDNDPYLSQLGIDDGEPTASRMVLKLFKSNEVYQATVDWIDLGKKDVPIQKVVYDYPNLEIHAKERDIWKLKYFAATKQLTWDHRYNFLISDPVLFTSTTNPPVVPEPLEESDFAPRPGSALQGYWVGKIYTGPIVLLVDFRIAQQADGTFRAESDDPLQGVHGRPVIVSYNPPNVELSLADGAGKFLGQIDNSHTVISGSWIKGSRVIPETIQRADYRAKQKQDADKDYSFSSDNDLQGHWKGTWIMPFGTVEVPIHFELDIAKLPDGSYFTTLASLDQFGAEGPIPASDFRYEHPNLHMEWKSTGGAYDGRLINGSLSGKWLQGGGGFTLEFKRSPNK